jgi:hypothetical protein
MGNTGVGVAEATDLFTVFPAPFAGTTVDNTSVLVRYTLYGDADLNRSVNLDDFNRLASNFGASPRRWSQGDFTFDTLVNLDDFNRLASNFGLSVAPAATISPRTNIGRRGSGEVDRRDDEEVPTLEDLYRAVGDAA